MLISVTQLQQKITSFTPFGIQCLGVWIKWSLAPFYPRILIDCKIYSLILQPINLNFNPK